jgi:hypothetical protein
MAAAAPKTKTTNDTASDARWKDCVKRELRAFERHQSDDRSFHVNLHNLASVTSKIGARPHKGTDASSDRLELQRTIQRKDQTPIQKYSSPVTSAHEYGWFASTAVLEPFPSTVCRSPEVKFATAYARSFHVGPFQKSQPMAR